MDEPIADRPLTEPHRDRLSPTDADYEVIVLEHALALSRGDIGYADPRTGLFVLTAAYLKSRGTCCHSGCRHCPFVA
ncbi:MAG: DUF5522 domain-containing protein [Acidimicrobiales bacterium]